MITAVVDILTVAGEVLRARVTGPTARAVENGVEGLDVEYWADDMALVSVVGATPEAIGFDAEPYGYWYAGPLAPVTVERVSLDESVPAWHGLGIRWDGWGITLPPMAPVRAVCMNTLRMSL